MIYWPHIYLVDPLSFTGESPDMEEEVYTILFLNTQWKTNIFIRSLIRIIQAMNSLTFAPPHPTLPCFRHFPPVVLHSLLSAFPLGPLIEGPWICHSVNTLVPRCRLILIHVLSVHGKLSYEVSKQHLCIRQQEVDLTCDTSCDSCLFIT